MSLNQRRRIAAYPQTSLWTQTHQLNILSANPTCLELVPEPVSNLDMGLAEQLRHTQAELQRYRMLYDNIPSVYLSLDVTGVILSVNQFGANCLGYTREQLIQQPILKLFGESEKQRLADEFKALLTDAAESAVNCGDFRLDCPLSQIKWVKVTLRFIPDYEVHKPVIIMLCEDITAHKQAEDTWRVSESSPHTLVHNEQHNQVLIPDKLEELESLTRLKEEFISTVSHELRTPLTNMKMAIQMLGIALRKEQKFEGNAESSKAACYFEILNNECDREINLINNFLDLKRLERDSQPLVLETIQIQQWLWQVVEKFKQLNFHLCQQNFSIKIPHSLPPLACDSSNLERIFIELLSNACKFSPPDTAIIISAEKKANSILLQVINSGVEIPSTELPRIFDKFYRIPTNDPAKQGGTGLGLALVQKLTQQLGGTITVESRSNRTCFTIQLSLKG
ncbi:PAS domain-containing sensor histidine kinase [Anabaena minutissima FACHB-250]|nr:PAS domain-containing sensor histidine kinase [Anabaena minutissima FACHB-250]